MKSLFSIFYFLLFLPSLFFNSFFAFSQHSLEANNDSNKGNIRGKVTDSEGLAVIGANVWLKNTIKGTSTNKDGNFELNNVKEGNYTIIVSALNIKHIYKEISIKTGQTNVVNFVISELTKELSSVEVIGKKNSEMMPLNEIDGVSIFAGKKSEVIILGKLDANLATNNARQVFAKTAGLSIWENDGSGVQINVAARGLSPNRSWEFNVRQNGYDISSDPFGYPEAYYNPPLEAVERIKIVRGAASLQYGAQFGGLLDYVLKKGDTQKPFSIETQQTIGSYGLFNTFNAIGGTKGKLTYYAYYQHRKADGWRENSGYKIDNLHFNISYAFTDKLKLGMEYTAMNYTAQQAGGLRSICTKSSPKCKSKKLV